MVYQVSPLTTCLSDPLLYCPLFDHRRLFLKYTRGSTALYTLPPLAITVSLKAPSYFIISNKFVQMLPFGRSRDKTATQLPAAPHPYSVSSFCFLFLQVSYFPLTFYRE